MVLLYEMVNGQMGNNTVDYYVFQQMRTNNFTDATALGNALFGSQPDIMPNSQTIDEMWGNTFYGLYNVSNYFRWAPLRSGVPKTDTIAWN